MLFKSALLTQASGSIGGQTASRNRGGMYLRARAIPVNPNTSRQIDVRAALTAAVAFWNTLTNPQREAWNLYAANTPVTNAIGNTVQLSGQNMMLRAYTASAQSGLSIPVQTAPTTFTLGEPPVIFDTTAVDVSSGISLAFELGGWSSQDNGGLLLYAGRPQNQGISFFRGPWRYVGKVQGDSVTPPTSPAVFATNPFPVAAGQKQWLAARVITETGVLSSQVIFGPVTVVA